MSNLPFKWFVVAKLGHDCHLLLKRVNIDVGGDMQKAGGQSICWYSQSAVTLCNSKYLFSCGSILSPFFSLPFLEVGQCMIMYHNQLKTKGRKNQTKGKIKLQHIPGKSLNPNGLIMMTQLWLINYALRRTGVCCSR